MKARTPFLFDGVLQSGPLRWQLYQINVAPQQVDQCGSHLLQFSEVIETARRERVRQAHGEIDIRISGPSASFRAMEPNRVRPSMPDACSSA